ncbi:hypothetical protein HY78_07985 [Rhizorhabdus wittichii DC-6]|nr:hypothetical protein HY78_07985 [Rhizorhabdus wittichii DC-6]
MSDYYSQEGHGPFKSVKIGDLPLEEGGSLPDCTLAVATHGTLNHARDNAILIPTWYSGTSKIIEQVLIGQGRALDPDRYFIIVVNQIGNGLSTSPHNVGGPHRAGGFPHIRITDDVEAQRRLLIENYGITRLALAVGGSMGAQQVYEWAVRYPDMVQRAAMIAGTARMTPECVLMTASFMEQITSDLGFAGGDYRSHTEVLAGLSRHARLWTILGWSSAFFRAERYKALGFASVDEFVAGFMIPYFQAMDPNNLLCTARKWQNGDVSRATSGDLGAALGRIKARTFVMPISDDLIFPVADCAAEQALIPNSELRPLESIDGHLALFGTDPSMIAALDRNLTELLQA